MPGFVCQGAVLDRRDSHPRLQKSSKGENMRIVAGEHRGRTLAVPKGLDTRPTTDRVREAVMSSIFSKLGGFEGVHILDAFSGTGAMGLEGMSRGASSAVLNDMSSDARECIASNVEMLHYDDGRVRVTSTDIFKEGFPRNRDKYDLVFLDPPYAIGQQEIDRIIREARDVQMLSPECLIVYEHASGYDTSDSEDIVLLDERVYGKTFVSYLTVA